MDKKELIIIGVIVAVVIVVAGIMFVPSSEAKNTSISVLNKGNLSENSTLYFKLDSDGNSLSDKSVHIKITNNESKVVYDKVTETQATGVAIVPLKNLTAGEYQLDASFDGDENYTGSSVSKKITIGGDEIEEEFDDEELVQQTIEDTSDTDESSSSQNQYSQSYSSSSSSSGSNSYSHRSSSSNSYSSSSSGSDSESSEELVNYDENGHVTLPEYDENGNEI